jgi:hypothetical protein
MLRRTSNLQSTGVSSRGMDPTAEGLVSAFGGNLGCVQNTWPPKINRLTCSFRLPNPHYVIDKLKGGSDSLLPINPHRNQHHPYLQHCTYPPGDHR